MKITDTKQTLYGNWNWTHLHQDTTGENWIDGCIVTENGTVHVFSQQGKHAFTSLRMAHNGSMHDRAIAGKYYTQRGLSRLAKRFAYAITL